ncbi:TRAP transporter large permease [Sulfitobacter sp. EhC04]|uniref:TRAP transporter large permease n=1 Tax=Sulfitobacter sp. EhC04 TaxID=1849168 RepID=UPI000AD781D8|nr:TRAP transporter large permease [Sulfitobacter sp. EhC04]
MTPEFLGVVAALLLIFMIAIRIPVAIALFVTGFVGYAGYEGIVRTSVVLSAIPAEMLRGYSLSVVPLFVFMGAIASRSGLSSGLYDAARAMMGSRSRAGLANATIVSCALFGSICGSSVATAATMTPIAIPEMRAAGYSTRLASAAVAAGGTIGILIPPSVILVIYALLVEESVPSLFAAAFIPGILLTLFCIVVVKVMVAFNPSLGGNAAEPLTLSERLRMGAGIWKIGVIFLVSLGGIYLGWFSPTEAAAVGSALALIIAVFFADFSYQKLFEAMDETIRTTAILFLIFMGALMFSRFVALSKLPVHIVDIIQSWGLAPWLILTVIVAIYLVLGCFLDTVAMILVTAPVFLPVVESLGYNAVWFGILIVVVAEMGLITPPLGMNIFVIRAQMPDIDLIEIIRGVLPFLFAHLALVIALVTFPQIANWLPDLLMN